MKANLLGLVTVLAAFAPSSSFAMFSDDMGGAAVTCGNGADIQVTITADRRKMVVLNDNSKTTYVVVNVKKPASDGDTFITYVGLSSAGSKAKLSFDDQGNVLNLDGTAISINECSSR
jgi:hypothetical protein